MRKADVEKIIALKKAGWNTKRIADEMHMDQDDVEKVMSDCMEKEEKVMSHQEKDGNGEKKINEEATSLLPGQLKEICERAAAIGAREALKIFEYEKKKMDRGRADRRLRNTKLLLRNYHMLKEHAKSSVFGRTQMEESAMDVLESMMSIYDNEVIIESIKRSATRTSIIVSHIETMFGLYRSYCEHTTNREIDLRRYDVIWDMYMADETLSVKELAKKYHISKDSVYSDLRMATERLTALIFGVDGLNVQ
jgi:Mor family transcriptional regulator